MFRMLRPMPWSYTRAATLRLLLYAAVGYGAALAGFRLPFYPSFRALVLMELGVVVLLLLGWRAMRQGMRASTTVVNQYRIPRFQHTFAMALLWQAIVLLLWH
jgi:hypothetical protein